MKSAWLEAEPVIRRRSWFSPRAFVWRAVALGVLFLIAHLVGLREYTTFLSGTTNDAGASLRLCAFYGATYIILYLGFVVVAPIFLLAAGILAVWERWVGGRVRVDESVGHSHPSPQPSPR